MDPKGTGHLTDNGERLLNLNLCASEELKVGGRLFHHNNICKWTWHRDKIMRYEKAVLSQTASARGCFVSCMATGVHCLQETQDSE